MRWLVLGALAALCAVGVARTAGAAQVSDVRLWSGPEGTRLVVDLSSPVRHAVFSIDNPHRVVIDLENAQLAMRKAMPEGQGPVKSVRSGPQDGGGLRIVLDLVSAQPVKSFMVAPEGSAGHRLVVELPPAAQGSPAQSPPGQPPPASAPTAPQVLAASSAALAREAAAVTSPVKTLAVAKGRDLVIAVDAGHGGQDPGAIGRGGTREKDVTLAIAQAAGEGDRRGRRHACRADPRR